MVYFSIIERFNFYRYVQEIWEIAPLYHQRIRLRVVVNRIEWPVERLLVRPEILFVLLIESACLVELDWMSKLTF